MNSNNQQLKTNETNEEATTLTNLASTTFEDDINTTSLSYNVLSTCDDYVIQQQSIKDFLEKPYMLTSGNWQTSDTKNTVLYSFDVASTILANTLWSNKLLGYKMFRGTVVCRLQINANPFQSGRLLLHFLPCATHYAISGTNYWVKAHNYNLTTKTQQPCVELDCRSTSVILRMPYVTPNHFYCKDTGLFDWGTFYVTVQSPLVTGAGGETLVNYNVYLHVEDLEMAAPMLPQSSTAKKRYKRSIVREYDKSYMSKITEEESEHPGPISQVLDTGSKVAASISAIPSLSAVAIPSSFIMRGLSALASYFGWSKPLNQTIPTSVNIAGVYRHLAAADGVSNAAILSLASENKLTVMDQNSVYDCDEMSFNFLKNVECYGRAFTWSNSDVSDSNLLQQFIGVKEFATQTNVVINALTLPVFTDHPIGCLARQFDWYRGSMKVKIKIIKTDYHSGRLQVTYSPWTGSTPVAPTTSTSQYALREIIDIRLSDEVELELPYLHGSNYLRITDIMGVLNIKVLTALRNPETAASSVEVQVFFSYCDNFELQGPTNFSSVPYVPQIGQIANKVIGNVSCGTVTSDYAQQSMGEIFTSLKQLLNRYTRVSVAAGPGACSAFQLMPWFTSMATSNQTTGAITGPKFGGDAMNRFSSWFAFVRGGVRIFYPLSAYKMAQLAFELTDANSAVTDILATNADTDWKTQAAGIYTGFGGRALATDLNSNGTEVHVPYMFHYKCALNIQQVTTNSVLIPVNAINTGVIFSTGSTATTATPRNFYRAGADDFQFSYFVGSTPYFITDPA